MNLKAGRCKASTKLIAASTGNFEAGGYLRRNLVFIHGVNRCRENDMRVWERFGKESDRCDSAAPARTSGLCAYLASARRPFVNPTTDGPFRACIYCRTCNTAGSDIAILQPATCRDSIHRTDNNGYGTSLSSWEADLLRGKPSLDRSPRISCKVRTIRRAARNDVKYPTNAK
ncbi:hypothetical protein PENSPDRAFT_495380 [Peniophora sp. CONT]|nr:hypothetical protein PENSPDRAFT_495380 [Peniophora sp. CONT]